MRVVRHEMRNIGQRDSVLDCLIDDDTLKGE